MAWDSYDNGSEFTPNITIKFNGVDQVEEFKPDNFRPGVFVPVEVVVTTGGLCSVYHYGTAVAHTVLAGWNPAATWEFGFGAATGGSNDNHWVDNFTVRSNVHDVTLDTLSGSGNLRLDVNGSNNITDTFGSVLSPLTFTAGQTYTIDTVDPVAICASSTVQLGAGGSVTVPVASIDGGSTDDVGIVLSTIDGSATKVFNCNNIGPNLVTLRVQDAAGNFDTCTATVTVVDDINPTVTCSSPSVTVNTDAGVCTGTVPDVISGILAANVNDNCTNDATLLASLVQSPTAGTTGASDGQLITVTVTDGSSNTGQCTVTLNVTDNEAPTVSCPGSASVNTDTGVCTGTVPDLVSGILAADVNDNCTDDTTLLGSLSQSPIAGTSGVSDGQVITVSVTDGEGLTGQCTVVLDVNDNENPVVTPNAGASTAVGIDSSFSDPGATASDNCGVAGGTTIASGTCISGDCSFDTSVASNTWTIEYSATDINGNGPITATTVFTVDADVTDPVFSNLAANPDTAVPDDIVTITFTSSEPLASQPDVLVNGDFATFVSSSKTPVDFEYTYTVPLNAPDGPAIIVITGIDPATNIGTLTSSAALTISNPESSLPVASWPLTFALGLAGAALIRRKK